MSTVGEVGKKVLEDTNEKLRFMVESIDNLQAFQISNGLGGGTGSGVTTNVTIHIKETFRSDKTLTSCYCVFPSPKLSYVSNTFFFRIKMKYCF